MDARYEAGSLVLDNLLWTPEPASWVSALVLTRPAVQVLPLWTVPFPAVPMPVDVPVSLPLPSIGWVGVWSGLITSEGARAVESAWVSTD